MPSGGVEETIIPEECITLRYYPGEIDAAVVKPAMQRIKGVQKVEIDARLRLILVTWKGKCKGIHQLETVAAAAGVPAYLLNHAHVYATLKTGRTSNLNALWHDLFDVPGVRGSIITGAQIELHADLQELAMDGLRKAARAANVEFDFTSHSWVEPALSGGDADRIGRELAALKGVVHTRVRDGAIGFWSLKSVKDEQLKAAVERAGGVVGALTRK
jgi:hypothetical protein